MNTGYKQAVIAYKVSKPTGEALDVNGQLVSASGRKQAIALLEGHVNPNPSKYEVEFYYNKNGIVTGNPTISLDVQSCPIGYIRVNPARLILEEPAVSATFILECSNDWWLISGPTNYMGLDYPAGSAGQYNIRVTGIAIGDGYFTFQNIATLQTATLYVANVSGRPWILETGYWNNLGFWYADGIWNYNNIIHI